jgi:hypothetical protein
MSDSYITLNDVIRQSTYFQQLPDLIVASDDLDGTPDTMPIIFEETYIPVSPSASTIGQTWSSDSLYRNSQKNSGNGNSSKLVFIWR